MFLLNLFESIIVQKSNRNGYICLKNEGSGILTWYSKEEFEIYKDRYRIKNDDPRHGILTYDKVYSNQEFIFRRYILEQCVGIGYIDNLHRKLNRYMSWDFHKTYNEITKYVDIYEFKKLSQTELIECINISTPYWDTIFRCQYCVDEEFVEKYFIPHKNGTAILPMRWRNYATTWQYLHDKNISTKFILNKFVTTDNDWRIFLSNFKLDDFNLLTGPNNIMNMSWKYHSIIPPMEEKYLCSALIGNTYIDFENMSKIITKYPTTDNFNRIFSRQSIDNISKILSKRPPGYFSLYGRFGTDKYVNLSYKDLYTIGYEYSSISVKIFTKPYDHWSEKLINDHILSCCIHPSVCFNCPNLSEEMITKLINRTIELAKRHWMVGCRIQKLRKYCNINQIPHYPCKNAIYLCKEIKNITTPNNIDEIISQFADPKRGEFDVYKYLEPFRKHAIIQKYLDGFDIVEYMNQKIHPQQ